MHTAFIKYGPTVQICKDAVSGTLSKFVDGLKNEVQSITNHTKILTNLATWPQETHNWLLVFPGTRKYRFPEARVISDYVEELLVARLMNLDARESYAIYNESNSYLALSNLKDRILERVVHSIIPRSRHAIIPMPKTNKTKHYVDLTGVSYRQFQNLESLSRDFRDGIYWVAEDRKILNAFHSVSIVKDTVYVFQITRYSKQSIHHTGLKSIRDALPQHLQSVEKWRFVWVVPRCELKAFSEPKTIEDAGGDTWHLGLRQFVMPIVDNLDLFQQARARIARAESRPVKKMRLVASDY
ncbi:hypothetical protein BD410DRAFT_780558 [Rickenella mellea]|uniref:Uncharacterized protein n=1 Tax=Rickenella mellea TaxID=50990 RepID=A0A4R5XGW3_9AGAM|nr:hypothetical protein BD410DRAFT_780558 [Rickenella mellea]